MFSLSPQPQYLGLEELCQEFAVELLGMCRNQSEVTTILNSCGDESQDALDQQAFEEGIPNLSRLRHAVNFNQKQVPSPFTFSHLADALIQSDLQ